MLAQAQGLLPPQVLGLSHLSHLWPMLAAAANALPLLVQRAVPRAAQGQEVEIWALAWTAMRHESALTVMPTLRASPLLRCRALSRSRLR